MKVISLHQPWASLIAAGRKVHETRHWRAPHNLIGERIAIHAAKRAIPRDIAPELHALCMDEFGCGYDHTLPFGALVCVATLASCKRMTEAQPASDDDRVAGHWSPERFAFRLIDVTPITPPIPYLGRQGWFDAPLEPEAGSYVLKGAMTP